MILRSLISDHLSLVTVGDHHLSCGCILAVAYGQVLSVFTLVSSLPVRSGPPPVHPSTNLSGIISPPFLRRRIKPPDCRLGSTQYYNPDEFS